MRIMNETPTPTGNSSASDIVAGDRILSLAPKALRPYLVLARIDRPIGTWLLLIPCWWSIALASEGWPDPVLFVLFAIGATVMRGAGCTINDIVDRDFDTKVARTATRPIASGQVSLTQAFAFTGLQMAIGLLILLQFNMFAVYIGIASLGLVIIYPFMKRFTYWPQFVLGLTFNWGALLGWAAVTGSLSEAPVILYVAGIFWTLGYDTIYAHMDKDDDIMIGVKSTALRLGEQTGKWLIGFYGLTLILIIAAGHSTGVGAAFYALLSLAALHLIWQIKSLDIHTPTHCLMLFKSNRDFGLLVLVAIMAGKIS